jgi:hypothetical protein
MHAQSFQGEGYGAGARAGEEQAEDSDEKDAAYAFIRMRGTEAESR